MERLTGYDADGKLIVCEEERLLCADGIIAKDEMYKIMRHLAERVAHYEDLEEQNRLFIMPRALMSKIPVCNAETPAEQNNNDWIPCSVRMPENEQEVEITYIRQHPFTGKKLYLTARAFYEDGTMTTENSAYNWENADNWEYDEKTESYIIPQGWYEDISFTEVFGIVDETVIAWKPVSEPYKEEEEQ